MDTWTVQKSYFDFVKEITADELYRGLMVHGLFAEKLPPFLSGESFYTYSLSLRHLYQDTPRQYIYFESIRDTNVPRPMGIPHPFAYQRLCHCLKENWSHIQKHFQEKTKGQGHKISRIHLRKMYDNPRLFEMSYKNWRIDSNPETDLMIGKHYLVNADISSCFPSIYSHALAWALVGKDRAKIERDDDRWFNQIDHYTQNVKHGETHGLLIGPHTSNLLSEIILTTVDQELYRQNWQYVRHIDDYKCYTKTHEEAQRFVIELNKKIQGFGLTLNHKKTSIQVLPQPCEAQWVRRLNSFTFDNKEGNSRKGVVNYTKVRTFLDLAVELMRENDSKSSILYYALKILYKKTLTRNAQVYCAKMMIHLAFICPYLVPLLDEFVFVPFQVESNMIAEFSRELFENEMKCANYEAVSYAIFFAIKYRFELPKLEVREITNSKHCIAILLAYLYFFFKNDQQCCKAIKKYAELLSQNEADFAQNWLLVYEVLPATFLNNEWKAMKRKGVSFIDKAKLNR